MYKQYNPNPMARHVGDCSVRALTKALDTTWENAYALTAAAGYGMADMQDSKTVFNAVLRQHGYNRAVVPNTCPDCYTVADFARENPNGTFVVASDKHVVAVVNGDWYDTWDSGDEVAIYYFYRR